MYEIFPPSMLFLNSTQFLKLFSVCSVLSAGISAVLDLTHTGHMKDLAQLSEIRTIPYFHVDITLQTFVHAMDAYVTARQGGDTIFIVRNDEGKLDNIRTT